MRRLRQRRSGQAARPGRSPRGDRGLRPSPEPLESRALLSGGPASILRDFAPDHPPLGLRGAGPAFAPFHGRSAQRSGTAAAIPTTGIFAAPGAPGQVTSATFTLLARMARYRDELGLFRVDDASGRVGDLLPGNPGYAAAALAPGRRQVVIGRAQAPGAVARFDLPAGSYFGLYIVQNATTDALVARNPNDLGTRRPRAFFSTTAANTDRFDHLHLLPGDVLAFEDMDRGGDRDFNDIVAQLQFGTPQGPIPSIAPAPAGQTAASPAPIVTPTPVAQGSPSNPSPNPNPPANPPPPPTPPPVHRPPVITSTPVTFAGFASAGAASGAVDPSSLTLDLAPGQAADRAVSLTLPQQAALVPKADVFLLFDDTGSFKTALPSVVDQFPAIVASLRQSMPGVSLGFGVGRFKDYAGVGGDPGLDRPFILSQPIITPDTPGFSQAIAAALARTGPGDGGDTPEALLEGLYQTATGAGFDGNRDGNTTDSGPAGLASTQTDPGPGGDVPAFGSFRADPSHDVLPPAGPLGGAGFRPGALPIILVATDAGTAYQVDGRDLITGVPGASVPLSMLTDTSRADPAGGREATFQGTVDALNRLGALVIGLGTNSDPTAAPRQVLSGLSTLTGAVNGTAAPIDSGIPGQPIAPGAPLYFQIDPTDSTSVAKGVQSAITSALQSVRFDVDLAPTDRVANLSGPVSRLGPGQTATFQVRLTGPSASTVVSLPFVRAGTGYQLGSIPVAFRTPYVYQVSATDPDGLPLTFRLLSAPDGARIDPQTGLLTWQPPAPGLYSFRVQADDGRAAAEQDFTLSVDPLPPA